MVDQQSALFYIYIQKKVIVMTFLSVMVQKFVLLSEAFAGPVTVWRHLIHQFT